MLSHCAHLYMLSEWVFRSHLPSIVGKFISHELSDREECQEFQLLVVQLLRSQCVDEDEGDRSCCDSELAGSRIDSIVILVDSFERLASSLSYLLIARNGSTLLLSPCHTFVMQSFAFTSCLRKIRSLSLLLNIVLIQSEYPMF